MFIIPVQELDDLVNDHFGSADAQTLSINNEAEVDEEERDDSPDWEKNESGPLFLTHCRYVDNSFIEMLLE